MAPSVVFSGILLSSCLMIVALAAPPHPPSSPAITAAISPHPQNHQQSNPHNQQEQLFAGHNKKHHNRRMHNKSASHHQLQEQEELLTSNDIDSNYDFENKGKIDSNEGNGLFLSNEIPDVEENEITLTEPQDSMERFNSGDSDDADDDDLGPALKVLARRKRTPKTTQANRPYSSSRGRAPSASRYRYPLYRKRSSRVSPQHDYPTEDPDEPFFNLYEDYPDNDGLYEPPRMRPQMASLFRERSTAPLREKFLEEPLASSVLHASPRSHDDKRDYTTAADSPYDLEALSQILDGGRKSEASLNPDSLDFFQDTLESLRRRKMEEELREEQLKMDETDLLQELANRAAEEYYQENNPTNYHYGTQNSLIRRKRNVKIPSVDASRAVEAASTNITNKTTLAVKTPEKVSVAEYRARLITDRKKRAFSSAYLNDRRKKSSQHDSKKRQSAEELDDFLTREYFKTIARSVGNKKKRMAYGRFEPEKRSSSIDAFLDNPEMLQYMVDQLKEAEASVAEDAEGDLLSDATNGGDSNSGFLLRNAVARMDALERMREALEQLKMLQAAPKKKRGLSRSGDNRRLKKSSAAAAALQLLQQQEATAPSSLHPQLLQTASECPALERLVGNCEGVSELAGDAGQLFLPACVRHEVCYMCGSGVGVSGHECDALLSSALEAECQGALPCLSAAGETFNLLSDARRYDHSGTCAHQPCVRNLINSRR